VGGLHHAQVALHLTKTRYLLYKRLRCKPEGHWFNSRWVHWDFSFTQSFRPHCGLGSTQSLTEMSTRNISCGGKDGQHKELTTLPPSWASCYEIWEFQSSGNIRACTGTLLLLFYIMICDFRQLTLYCLHWTFLLWHRIQLSSFLLSLTVAPRWFTCYLLVVSQRHDKVPVNEWMFVVKITW